MEKANLTDQKPDGVFLEALRSILQSIPKRSQDILEARFGITSHKPKTLEEIGKEYGITRERVRQIICSALHTLVKHHEAGNSGGRIETLVQDQLRAQSGIMTAENLLATLTNKNKEERGALMAFLECLPYARSEKTVHEHEKIYFLNDFSHEEWKEVKNIAKKILEALGQPVSAKKLATEFFATTKKKVTEKELFDYLAVSSEVQKNVFGKWGLSLWSDIKPRGTREKAYLILKNKKEPMHFRAIAQAIDEAGLREAKKRGSHPQTVHNELIKDSRFVLVGRGIYALASWGYSAGTVKDVIAKVLLGAGKPLTKKEVIEAVLLARKVKPTTITINLNTFFDKNEEGLYMAPVNGLKKRK
jgi:predicted RNA binding protein YcfA (HicA-like mRNA interferase family)